MPEYRKYPRHSFPTPVAVGMLVLGILLIVAVILGLLEINDILFT